MNTLKILTAILIAIGLWGCKKDNTLKDVTNELYSPALKSLRNNRQVVLQWQKPWCPFECPQFAPDRFEILMSNTDPSRLQLQATVTGNVFSFTINSLTNGTPYYFAIKAVGDNKKPALSNTIMIIPGNAERIETILPVASKSREQATWSSDRLTVAYTSEYTWNNGNNSSQSIFMYSLANNTERLIEKGSRSPEWSPTQQKIAYHTDNGEINTSQGYRPTHIAVYNIQDSTIERLTRGNSFNFLPTWSPDGKWIAFLSDRAGSKEYNVWKVPADNSTAIQITKDLNDFTEMEGKDSRSPKSLSWSKDGSRIAFGLLRKFKGQNDYDIYTVPANGGNKTTVISSRWNDFCPAYSPDGITIAFVSDRSGSNEIWTMNLLTGKFKQITGSTGKWIYENRGKIEWSATGNKILFIGDAGAVNTLYTVDVN